MINSVRQCSCFNYMLSSLKSIAMAKSRKEVQHTVKADIENKAQSKNQTPYKQSSSIKQQAANCLKDKADLKSNSLQQSAKNQNYRFPTQKRQSSDPKDQEIQPQSERNFIKESLQLQNISQSNQYDLPTQKSENILNDICLDIDKNQNNYLYSQQKKQSFVQLYQILRFVNSSRLYDEYEIKKHTNGQFFIGKIMKSFQSLSIDWNLPKEDSIQRFTEIYEKQKHHLKCMIQLCRHNCRHLTKLFDYELKPPTINPKLNNQFDSGAISIVYEKTDSTLQEVLKDKQNDLSKQDKKKLIYQICTCLADIHARQFSVKDLSVQSFRLDRFCNIKLFSSNIQAWSGTSMPSNISLQSAVSSEQNRQKSNELMYLSPEQLKKATRLNKNKNTQNENSKPDFSLQAEFQILQPQDKRDLWRLGIIIAKILTDSFLFNSTAIEEQFGQIMKILHNQNQTKECASFLCIKLLGLSLHEIKLIQSLLKIRPSERTGCKQLLKLQYFDKILEDSCHY